MRTIILLTLGEDIMLSIKCLPQSQHVWYFLHFPCQLKKQDHLNALQHSMRIFPLHQLLNPWFSFMVHINLCLLFHMIPFVTITINTKSIFKFFFFFYIYYTFKKTRDLTFGILSTAGDIDPMLQGSIFWRFSFSEIPGA